VRSSPGSKSSDDQRADASPGYLSSIAGRSIEL
jgi:hypothetical protein